jgi:hypothetical protein
MVKTVFLLNFIIMLGVLDSPFAAVCHFARKTRFPVIKWQIG